MEAWSLDPHLFAYHYITGTWHSAFSLVSAQRKEDGCDHEDYNYYNQKGNLHFLSFFFF